MPRLYLIPNLLADIAWQSSLPASVPDIVRPIRFFIVEDIRNARRYLRRIVPEIDIDSLQFFELNKHTTEEEKSALLQPLLDGHDTGLISEAGCPGVADPGADVVRLAHRHQIRVVPLVGPSSILLALMSSGLNGQNFTFSGYLPVKPAERMKKIQQLEKVVQVTGQAQIFMETPYRNNYMLADLLKVCQAPTLLCIAANVTADNEMIHTRSIAEWRKKIPNLEKQPVIFILGR